MINPYKKGARTEREIAKRINDVLGSSLRRTPMSGAHLSFPGDLITTQDEGKQASKWIFDVKNRKDGFTILIRWFKKLKEETPWSKKPAMILTSNNEDAYAFISLDDFLSLLKDLDHYEHQP